VAELDLRHQPPIALELRPDMPARFSQTFLRHAANCMHSGYLYLKFKGGPGSHEMERGTATHLISERMGRHALEYGEPVVPHEIVREIVNEVVAEVGIAPSEIDYLHVLAYHLSEALTFDPQTLVGLERKVVMEIGGYTVSGKIDLAWVDGTAAGVRDYKTSMNLPDNSAWGPGQTEDGKKRIRRFLFQALLYALMLKYGRPVSRCNTCGGSGEVHRNLSRSVPPDPQLQEDATCLDCGGEGEIAEHTPLAPRAETFDVGEWYPAYMYEDDQGVKRLVERSTVIALEELENHRRWLEALIGRVASAFETGEWPAVPGSHCNECPAERLCPIPPVLRDRAFDPETGEVIVVDSNEAARAALALRDRLNADAAQLWDQAKAWADKGNTIVVGDQVYEFKPTTTKSVKKAGSRTDWDGFLEAIEHAQETGEPFPVDKWIKESTSTRFQKRALRPDEKTPDYPEEVETNGSSGRSDKGEARGGERAAAQGERDAGAGSQFGDEPPF
jgi:hypothetical protein